MTHEIPRVLELSSCCGWDSRAPDTVSLCDLVAAGDDNDVKMDGGPVKDGDMDSRGQPALPPEK
jgi:hypothetical protein